MMDLADIRWQLEQRKREVTLGGAVLAGILVLVLLLWLISSGRQPPPSIFDSPVEDVLGFLSMDDFSELPLEERMAFLIEFSDRFRGMNQQDSAAMAAFLAGLAGPVREQATDNARILAKDILVNGAEEYVNLPAGERAAFLDDWVLKWTRLGERMVRGEERQGVSDEDRVNTIKDGARADSTREIDDENIPELTGTSAVRFMDFWANEVETTASPREQGQIVLFMNDLRKHLTAP
jgi:type IV secretory pathway TrbD component